MSAPSRPRTPFGKAWKAGEMAMANGAVNGQLDAWGVAESYRFALTLRERLSALARDCHGFEHDYLVAALSALDGRMHAQYAFVRDTLGWYVASSTRSLDDLRAEYEAQR